MCTCDLSTYQDAIYATREQLGMFPKQLHGRMLAYDLALYFWVEQLEEIIRFGFLVWK